MRAAAAIVVATAALLCPAQIACGRAALAGGRRDPRRPRRGADRAALRENGPEARSTGRGAARRPAARRARRARAGRAPRSRGLARRRRAGARRARRSRRSPRPAGGSSPPCAAAPSRSPSPRRRAGDAARARTWMQIRDFRQTTRFTRPGVDGTAALQELAAGEISPPPGGGPDRKGPARHLPGAADHQPRRSRPGRRARLRRPLRRDRPRSPAATGWRSPPSTRSSAARPRRARPIATSSASRRPAPRPSATASAPCASGSKPTSRASPRPRSPRTSRSTARAS